MIGYAYAIHYSSLSLSCIIMFGSIFTLGGLIEILLGIVFYRHSSSLAVCTIAFIVVLTKTLILAGLGAKPYYPYMQFFNIGFLIFMLGHIIEVIKGEAEDYNHLLTSSS